MKRLLLLLSSLLLLAMDGGASHARPQTEPESQPPAPRASPAPHDPLEEFVPHEKLDADSVVAMPVDI